MKYDFNNSQFPAQRVDFETKETPDWYANCIDYIIGAGQNLNDRSDTETKLAILRGDVPYSYYKKVLNPYNSNNEKHRRFPATMRNLDIMNDIVRRYVSEYFKGVHEFIVSANDPSIVAAKNAKVQEEVSKKAQQAFQQAFEAKLKQAEEEAAQSGQEVEDIKPEDVVPDMDAFVKDIQEKYIDEKTEQGEAVLEYIKSMTKDDIIYLSAYFNFVTLGECYTYADVRNNDIIKENVPVMEAYPIPNNEYFVEDQDMFARRTMLSYNQILDMFDKELTDKDRAFLEKYYNRTSTTAGTVKSLYYRDYFEFYPDVCSKFQDEERRLFEKDPINVSENNNTLYEVWHVVWKGQVKKGILTYLDPQSGIETTRIVDETYKFNKALGDLNLEWTWDTQVYEGYRIGGRYDAIYPIKCRAIAYNRNGKLPYNGIMEILPYMGKFSIIKLITPYQIMRNIFAYHREMVIAKNKMLILLLPKSLIESDAEDILYKMAADGTLLVDDTEDANSQKMANIRMLNANMGDYIRQITDLMEATKLEAREMVDMNAQRYGQIAQSAGASTTQQAVTQSAMGSVIISHMFDELRRSDYNRDMDFAKLAYIDGLNVGFRDTTGVQRYLSLDVNAFINADYSVTARNDAKEIDKLQQLKQWAFSAAQNGDLEMAIAAITGDNVSQIKTLVAKFADIKRQHESEMQRAEQMLKQEEVQAKLQEIAAQGEEDRKTAQLKYQYELQSKYIDVDMALLGNSEQDDGAAERLSALSEQNKVSIEQEKANLKREEIHADMYNKAADRQVKLKDIETKLKIAKTNKNKYDK